MKCIYIRHGTAKTYSESLVSFSFLCVLKTHVSICMHGNHVDIHIYNVDV